MNTDPVIAEALALWAKMKKGDEQSWQEFQDTVIAASQGEPDSRHALAALLTACAQYTIPCCASCAHGLECESKRQAPTIGGCGCSPANRSSGAAPANRPLVGFCCI